MSMSRKTCKNEMKSKIFRKMKDKTMKVWKDYANCLKKQLNQNEMDILKKIAKKINPCIKEVNEENRQRNIPIKHDEMKIDFDEQKFSKEYDEKFMSNCVKLYSILKGV